MNGMTTNTSRVFMKDHSCLLSDGMHSNARAIVARVSFLADGFSDLAKTA